MTRILVLYYSSYGHIARMAEAVAAGAREAGAACWEVSASLPSRWRRLP